MESSCKESTRLTEMLCYKFDNIGIGDLTHIACEVMKSDSDVIKFCINADRINLYRKNDSGEYTEFVQSYLRRVLPQKRVEFEEDQSFPIYSIRHERYEQFINDDQIHAHFKKVFSNPSVVIDEPYTVISTKARSYSRGDFNSIKEELFRGLNSQQKKIVLLGEREVESNAEYEVYGENLIYSIYDDVITHVDSSLLVDMTFPKLGFSTPDIDRLFGEVSLAYSANSVINVGIGGFFCLTSLGRNLKAIVRSNDQDETLPGMRGLLNKITFNDVGRLLQRVDESFNAGRQTP